MADEVGSGVFSGAATGAGLGTEILPGWGTAIGAVAGGILGGISASSSKKSKEKDQLPLTDPYQIELLNSLKTKQRSLDTGAAYQPQQDLVKQAGYKAMDNVVKITGGDIGASVSALNSAQRATGRNMNELFSEMSAESFKMDELMEGLVGKIANRRLEIQGYELGQANVTVAQNKQSGMQNIMGMIAQNKGLFQSLLSKKDTGGMGSGNTAMEQSAFDEYSNSAASNIPTE